MHKRLLSLDIETRSDVDLPKHGVYNYVNTPHFRLLWLSYSYDYGPVQTIDLYHETLPDFIIRDLQDPEILKCAANATFERICMSRILGVYLDPSQWTCTLVLAGRNGLPMHLDGAAFHSGVSIQKDSAGKDLIMTFSVPQEINKKNPWRQWINPQHEPEKWAHYGRYNNQDVGAEMAVKRANMYIPISRAEDMLYTLDQRINDRGIKIDRQLVQQAMAMGSRFKAEITNRVIELTGIKNPNSVQQLVKWLNEETDLEKMAKLPGKTVQKLVESLDKQINEGEWAFMPNETVGKLLVKAPPGVVKEVLECRLMLGKASISKYTAMNKVVGWDDRIRGVLAFYGANRTGRWCLTGDHEVLTPEGWKRLDEWQGGEMAVWNAAQEGISFQKCTPNAFDYEGEMHCIETQRCSQVATPEHKMPVWTEKGWQAVEVKELPNRFQTAFTGKRHTSAKFGDIGLRILIMVQADGHFTDDGVLRLHFKKERKIDRCRMLLNAAEIPFTFETYSDRSVFKVSARDLPLWLRQFKSKKFGWWMLDENADTFFDELECWDGYRSATNSVQYSSTCEENVDIVQAMAALSGRCCTKLVKHRPDKASWNDCYIANIWMTPGKSSIVRKEDQSYRVFSPLTVYCPTTPTGFFMVRRMGKVWVTGNSGRGVQPQNLTKHKGKAHELEAMRSAIKSGDIEAVRAIEPNVASALSQCIRTAFVADQGHQFLVSDYSAIEARVTAWLAAESWRLDFFEHGGDIYVESVCRMLGLNKESLYMINSEGKRVLTPEGKNYRAIGKVAELALGFLGGVGALKSMCAALGVTLPEHEMQPIVDAFREANTAIVEFGYDLERAAIRAIVQPEKFQVAGKTQRVQFVFKRGNLYMILPSGRWLTYQKAFIGTNKFGKPGIFYYESKNKGWHMTDTYSGKLLENSVQATARDLLAGGMLRLDYHGFKIVLHVHDEVVIEEPINGRSLEEVNHWMCQKSAWYQDLPFEASGFVSPYYKKDDN